MKQLRIHITGQVQGVAFRAAAREQAEALGIAGFARNEPDGSVYVESEGEPTALKQFLAWCHDGPPSAKVESVTFNEHAPTGHRGFRRL